MNVSICMATFNGERFIRQQIESILLQMESADELIVIDDGSKDATVDIIQSYKDPRIRLYVNDQNLGHVRSFARSIGLSNNPIIVLADQDDIWTPERLSKQKNAIEMSGAILVTGNSTFVDSVGGGICDIHPGLRNDDSEKYLLNVLRIFTGKAFYYGCTMAFNREILQIVLPIPGYVESHDLWIAMAANMMRSNFHLQDIILMRRIHGTNVTNSNRSFFAKIKSRAIFLISLFHLSFRMLRAK